MDSFVIVQCVEIEGSQKIQFGPLRVQVACGSGLVAVLAALAAIEEHHEHDAVLAWVLLIVSVESLLLSHSILRRYIRFSEDGYFAHAYQCGLIPRTKFRAFKDIDSVSIISGPRGFSNIEHMRIDRADGQHRLIVSASRSKKTQANDATSVRFEKLVADFREAIGETSQ
jgi:hypothetical protein